MFCIRIYYNSTVFAKGQRCGCATYLNNVASFTTMLNESDEVITDIHKKTLQENNDCELHKFNRNNKSQTQILDIVCIIVTTSSHSKKYIFKVFQKA